MLPLGVVSLVGGESSQSLASRVLVSALCRLDAVSVLILACDSQTRAGVELTFTPTVIFASFCV